MEYIALAIKRLIFTIMMIFLLQILTSCNKNNPYLQGLENLSGNENLFYKTLLGKTVSISSTQLIYGYLNKSNSTLYSSSDLVEEPGRIEKFLELGGITLYEDFSKDVKLKIPEKCKAYSSLVKVIGKVYVDNGTYYIQDIETIYDFDTRPKADGGTGEHVLCYKS